MDWQVTGFRSGRFERPGIVLDEDGVWREAGAVEEAEEPKCWMKKRKASWRKGSSPKSRRSKRSPNPNPKVRRQEVVVQRKGTLRLPLPILVRFTDGTEERFTWTREDQAKSTWWRVPLSTSLEKIDMVLLDPDRNFYIDGNKTDNQWYRSTKSHGPSGGGKGSLPSTPRPCTSFPSWGADR